MEDLVIFVLAVNKEKSQWVGQEKIDVLFQYFGQQAVFLKEVMQNVDRYIKADNGFWLNHQNQKPKPS